MQNCFTPEQTKQLLFPLLPVIELNCHSVWSCRWLILDSHMPNPDEEESLPTALPKVFSFLILGAHLWTSSWLMKALGQFYSRICEGYCVLQVFIWYFRKWIISICTDWHCSHWDSPQGGNTACSVPGGTLAGARAEEERGSAVICLEKDFLLTLNWY